MNEYLEQWQITEWEKEHSELIKGWQIEYIPEYDIVTFFLNDGTTNTFKRKKAG